jgi:alpha-dioxygenase
MNTNWYGIIKALKLPKWLDFLGAPLSLIGHDKTTTFGVPYCLTEEFAAVYRLHPLIPDNLLIGEEKTSIPIEELFAEKGQAALRSTPDMPHKLLFSVLKYPCGNLELHNYPGSFRQLDPTNEDGIPKTSSFQVDLAALELWRDRERGIQRHNDFRRALSLKPFKNFEELTSYISGKVNQDIVNDLVEAYGKNGIEDMDLLVGCLAEDKIEGFAISETAFTIFLLMASRRLETSPFLNEKFTDKIYSSTGKEWIDKTLGLRDVLERHYPKVAEKIPPGQSAFKPFEKMESKLTDG